MGLRERKKQQTRMSIIAIADEKFRTNGFDDTSIEEIADLANVSAGTVYNYFPTKVEILIAAILERSGGFVETSNLNLATLPAEPAAAVKKVIGQIFKMLDDYDRDLMRRAYASALDQSGAASADYSRIDHVFEGMVNAVISRFAETGVISTDPGLVSRAAFNLGNGEFNNYLTGKHRTMQAALRAANKQIDLLFSGVK